MQISRISLYSAEGAAIAKAPNWVCVWCIQGTTRMAMWPIVGMRLMMLCYVGAFKPF